MTQPDRRDERLADGAIRICPERDGKCSPQGVEITEAMVQVGRRAILKCRFYDPEPHMYDSEAAFFAHIETTDHWPEAEDEARNALTAALSPTGRDAE